MRAFGSYGGAFLVIDSCPGQQYPCPHTAPAPHAPGMSQATIFTVGSVMLPELVMSACARRILLNCLLRPVRCCFHRPDPMRHGPSRLRPLMTRLSFPVRNSVCFFPRRDTYPELTCAPLPPCCHWHRGRQTLWRRGSNPPALLARQRAAAVPAHLHPAAHAACIAQWAALLVREFPA